MVKKYHPRLYNGNQMSVPHSLWKMVLKFQEWHRDSVTIRKICIAPSTILSEPYLIEPSQMLRHPTAYTKILFTGLFRIASTAPSPATPHIWKFPTPRSSSRGCAAWRALTVWHSEHANYTIPGRFPSIFFAITYVYSLCVLLIGCILPVVAVKSEKII